MDLYIAARSPCTPRQRSFRIWCWMWWRANQDVGSNARPSSGGMFDTHGPIRNLESVVSDGGLLDSLPKRIQKIAATGRIRVGLRSTYGCPSFDRPFSTTDLTVFHGVPKQAFVR